VDETGSVRWHLRRFPGGWTIPDGALAAGFLVLLVSEIVPNPDMTPHVPLLVLSVVLCGALAWRRAHPAQVAVVVCLAYLGISLVSTGTFTPQLTIIPTLVVLYSAASRTRDGVAVTTAVLTALLTVAAWVVTDEGDAGDFWPWMLWAGAWAAGTFVRRREDVAAHHAARAASAEAEARTAAAESALAERDRIARELHDVVAHAVSVIVVQAGAERLRLGPDAGTTGQALEAIEESGRTALTELRTMLGVLRDRSDESLDPPSGGAAVPALIDRLQAAGLPVTLSCRPTDALAHAGVAGSAVGMAAYRIIQEALTNVVRHAGMVPTQVDVELLRHELQLAIANGPPDLQHPKVPPGGRGVTGMRERTTALGGRFETEEHDGGYTVRATLPLKPVAVQS
jgi:signal transduction histidine kinase